MSELDTTFNSEENTNQENETEVFEQEENSNAEGAKIAAILERKNKKIAELEAQLNKDGGKAEEKAEPQKTGGLSREEAILFAKGLSEEAVNKASKIAKIEGISLTEATRDPMFTAWKQSEENRVKAEKANIGTSNGTKKAPEKKSFESKDLSKEEHMELFNKRVGK